MKKYVKQAVLGMLAGSLCLGMLTGCGRPLEGTETIATVNGEEIPAGVVSFMVRYQQAQTEAMYAALYGSSGGSMDIWDTVADEESGETYGEQAVKDVLEQAELMYILKEKAADYDVALTEEDTKAIEEAAAGFIEANDEETLKELSVSEDVLKTVLELYTYQNRIYDPIVAEADTEVSDEEAQRTSLTYVRISNSDADSEDLSDEEKEEAKEEKKQEAQDVLDKVLAAGDGDMDAAAKEINEDLSATETSFVTNAEEEEQTIPKEVRDAVKDLKDGETAASVVESEDSYYVVRLDKAFDEEKTEEERESLIAEKQQEFYTDTTDGWMEEADITEENKVMEKIEVTDSHKFTIQQEETQETDETASEEETSDSAQEDTAAGEAE